MWREISDPWPRKTRIRALMAGLFRSPEFEMVSWFFAFGLSVLLYLFVTLPDFSRLVVELEEQL